MFLVAGGSGELDPGPRVRGPGDRSRFPGEPGPVVRLAADAPVRHDAEDRVEGEGAGMLGVQDLPGLSRRQGPVLRLVLAREQVQSAQRLPGRCQGPALLDLVQKRQMHHHHDRHAGPVATHDRQNVGAGHREPADTLRPVSLRVLHPGQDPDYKRVEEVVRRELHHAQDRSAAVNSARGASLHRETLGPNDERARPRRHQFHVLRLQHVQFVHQVRIVELPL